MATQVSELVTKPPKGNLAGLSRYWQADLASGFLVFLIALPLCLGIAIASGFPPVAGVFTAIVGGMVAPLFSNSELTVKGPAAGLIVVVLGAMLEFGYTGGKDLVADATAYRAVLGIGVAAGVIQILFGLFRSGVLGEFFPTAAVHGLLASIGVIIMSKQIHVVVGQSAPGTEPIEWIEAIPHSLLNLNPEIAAIGLTSLVILFGWAWIPFRRIRSIPPQIVVVLLAMAMGVLFDLTHEHTYTFAGRQYPLGEKYLVNVPSSLFGAFVTPSFGSALSLTGAKWVVMFALIGSLESMLSAKAIDLIDPYRRKTDMNRDLLGIGVANTLAACLGGLPMISEIVRSRANIDNGGKTRFANVAHGLFLLLFVALVPWLIHRIPLAALAAMLVFTGFRLASPREFISTYKVGPEHFAVFVCTILGVLATDLLIGIGIGVAVKFAIHLHNGAPLASLLKSDIGVEKTDSLAIVTVRRSAIFSTWIPLRSRIASCADCQTVIVDLADTFLVDHTVMEKLHDLGREFVAQDRVLIVQGLDNHTSFSKHELATRKRRRDGSNPPTADILNSDTTAGIK
jgi:MFS superfamily sulfate permease-like transporter